MNPPQILHGCNFPNTCPSVEGMNPPQILHGCNFPNTCPSVGGDEPTPNSSSLQFSQYSPLQGGDGTHTLYATPSIANSVSGKISLASCSNSSNRIIFTAEMPDEKLFYPCFLCNQSSLPGRRMKSILGPLAQVIQVSCFVIDQVCTMDMWDDRFIIFGVGTITIHAASRCLLGE